MSRQKTKTATFTQRDVVRAIKAVKATGLEIGTVRVETDGAIVVVLGAQQPVTSQQRNDWD